MEPYQGEFLRHRSTMQKAIEQVGDDAFFRPPARGMNSIAILVKHLAGNLKSRFMDFPDEDGEKPWRNRDGEFTLDDETRSSLLGDFEESWDILMNTLAGLGDADRARMTAIRGIPLTVEAALCRSVSHFSYHVGQIVGLARLWRGEAWTWLTIAPGKSEEFNRDLECGEDP